MESRNAASQEKEAVTIQGILTSQIQSRVKIFYCLFLPGIRQKAKKSLL